MKARGNHIANLWISNRQSIQRLIYIQMGSTLKVDMFSIKDLNVTFYFLLAYLSATSTSNTRDLPWQTRVSVSILCSKPFRWENKPAGSGSSVGKASGLDSNGCNALPRHSKAINNGTSWLILGSARTGWPGVRVKLLGGIGSAMKVSNELPCHIQTLLWYDWIFFWKWF